MSFSLDLELDVGTTVPAILRVTAKSESDLVLLSARDGVDSVGGYLTADVRDDADVETGHAGEAVLQLMEDVEYEYVLSAPGAEVLGLHPQSFWSGMADVPLHGRLKPRRWIGTAELRIECSTRTAVLPVEVRSRKLLYRSEYRWMLAGIFDKLVDLVLHAFSPSEVAAFTTSSDGQDARTVYQRFASLTARLRSTDVQAALARINRDPHRLHEAYEEERPLQRARANQRTLTRSAGKGDLFVALGGAPIGFPRRLASTAFKETVDTPANRFVRFMLEEWRDHARTVRAILDSAPVDLDSRIKGLMLADDVMSELDEHLASPVLRHVGRFDPARTATNVVQRRAGYRELYAQWLQSLLAFEVSWSSDDRIPAGTRDIAQSYETWCFLQVLAIVEQISGEQASLSGAYTVSKGGLQIDLSRGRVFSLQTTSFGVPMTLALHYNKSYSTSANGSWSVGMRPDITLVITPHDDKAAEVIVHFDAKYRIDTVGVAWADAAEDEDVVEEPGTAKRADIEKMHAYRDAIRRSVGSYVLFPGRDEGGRTYEPFTELVPGVGAFGLRPTTDGSADSGQAATIRLFLRELVTHVASRSTKRFRADYWAREAYGESVGTGLRHSLRTVPPADVSVLLGYVKSPAHLEWTMRHGRYLLRADQSRAGAVSHDSAALRTDLIVLWSAQRIEKVLRSGSTVEVVTSHDELLADYPDRHSASPTRTYFALVHGGSIGVDVEDLQVASVIGAQSDFGAPVVTTFDEICKTA
ncbi:DUF2357 domain-containing protein [Rhodococcus sp. BP-316]|uniref:DUF2357 domain-containing protein n=1 Tax=Rhodococcus sp. BP-316 TaxID=2739445 RepID=UPI001C9A743E|nr:DUF2357 domain-containing protein [Rhodococcus sp. BP-316]MBY6682325.1 DUF2357 domain-containing protein [Rhodococcus sp. BP-316]